MSHRMTFKVNRVFFQILIILIISLSEAKFTYSQKLIIGIKGGASISKSHFDDNNDNQEFTNLWKPGYFGAALIRFPLIKNFSLQVETGLSQRGRKIEFNNGTSLNNAAYQFIDGGLLLRKSFPIKWSRNSAGSWFVNAGPKVSYWLSGKGKTTMDGVSYDYRVKFDNVPENFVTLDYSTMYLSEVNRWLFGLDFGLGVDAPTPALEKFTFELRYTLGRTFYGEKNSANYPIPGFSDNLLANENVMSLSIHYIFNRDSKEGKKGKSIKKDVKKSKPRKNIDSMIH
jgi:hypothetical protein